MTLLADVLSGNPPLGVASVISHKLHRSIFGESQNSTMRSPYFLSFYSVVMQLIEFLAARGIREKVDFIFDIQPGQMEAAIASWEHMRHIARDDIKAMIGSVGFHDDECVIPLQAADLSAGWMREQADSQFSGQPEQEPPWGNRTNHIQSLIRIWTAELYEKLAQRTGAFKMPPR